MKPDCLEKLSPAIINGENKFEIPAPQKGHKMGKKSFCTKKKKKKDVTGHRKLDTSLEKHHVSDRQSNTNLLAEIS